MKQVLIKGANLSKSKIERVIKRLRPSEKERILDNYWYLINLDWTNDDDKIGEFICSIPNVGQFPDEMIIFQLVTGPMSRVPRNYEHTINWYIKNIVEKQDDKLVKSICDFMANHKHCPDKYKTTHMLLQATIQQTIDDVLQIRDLSNVDDEEMWQSIIKHLKGCAGYYKDVPRWVVEYK